MDKKTVFTPTRRWTVVTFDDAVAPEAFYLEVAHGKRSSTVNIVNFRDGKPDRPFVSLNKTETKRLITTLMDFLTNG
jgi:hypothetical protein